jgi:hypothetical protein
MDPQESNMPWEGCPNALPDEGDGRAGPRPVETPASSRLHCRGCEHLLVRQDYGGPRPAYRHVCTHPEAWAGLSESLRACILNCGGAPGYPVGYCGWDDVTPAWCPYRKKGEGACP